MNCPNCNEPNTDDALFCCNCGTKLSSPENTIQVKPADTANVATESTSVQQPVVTPAPQPTQSYQSSPNNNGYNTNAYNQFDTTPISMWGYFGYEILFSIPCVGLICLIVFSFGGTRNINVRNFARSYFCFLIVLTILIIFLAMIGALGSAGSGYY